MSERAIVIGKDFRPPQSLPNGLLGLFDGVAHGFCRSAFSALGKFR